MLPDGRHMRDDPSLNGMVLNARVRQGPFIVRRHHHRAAVEMRSRNIKRTVFAILMLSIGLMFYR